MLCKNKSLSLNWLKEGICKIKILWPLIKLRDLQCCSDLFIYILLYNSVFSENYGSFQVKILIHGHSAALQKVQRLSPLCLLCSKWQIFVKEAQIKDLQLMTKCCLSEGRSQL